MKFKCGPTEEEKKDQIRKAEVDVRLMSCWRRWFAWYPVKVDDGDCRWLETILYRYPNAFVDIKFLSDGYKANPLLPEYKATNI